MDEYLGHAIELDVDAASDGKEVLIGAVMEHLEEAGIHSGDSTCFIPTQNISDEMLERVRKQTKEMELASKSKDVSTYNSLYREITCIVLKSTKKQ